jgi:hypothetical protein
MSRRALAAYQVRRLINRTSVPIGGKFHRAATGGAQESNVESIQKAMASYFAKTG